MLRDTNQIQQRLEKVIEEYLALDSWLREVQSDWFRVCIFGSARINPQDKTYGLVMELARNLAMDGIDIVTGGGPGLMEAANRGVREAHNEASRSYGVTIELPRVQEVANKHLDIKSSHKRFSSRLDEFMRLTHAVIVAPGGIGTLLEMMYVWQLLQVGLIEERPVVLLDRAQWGGLIDYIQETMVQRGFVSPEDMDHVHLVDTPDEALQIVRKAHQEFLKTRAQSGTAPPAGIPPLPPAEEELETLGLTSGAPLSQVPLPVGAPPAPPARRPRKPAPEKAVQPQMNEDERK